MGRATKTLIQMQNEGYEYPDFVSRETCDLIDDWFGNRIVSDDDSFPMYINRVLGRDYHRYEQLLRIEPGFAQYDWLVQHYTETEQKTKDNSQKTSARNYSDTRDNTGNTDISDYSTNTNRVVGNTTQTAESSETAQNDINTEGRQNVNNQTTSTGNNQYTENGTTDNTRTVNMQTSGNGDKTAQMNNSKSGTTNYTDEEKGRTTHNSTGSETVNTTDASVNKQAQKAAPMSIAGETMGVTSAPSVNGVHQLPGYKWDYATSIGENDVDATHAGTNNTVQNDTDNNNRDLTHIGNNSETDHGTTTEHSESTDLQTGTDQNVGQSQATGSSNNSVNTVGNESTENTGTSNAQMQGEASSTTVGESTQDTEGTVESASQIKNTNGSKGTGSEQTTLQGNNQTQTRMRTTGRSTAPAQLLDDAKRYIQTTSAWEWLRVQLEPCFLGVYDI